MSASLGPDVYLASKSPRRQELLNQVGIRFELIAVDVDESRLPDEPAIEYVRRLAAEKAQAGAKVKTQNDTAPSLGADTIVSLDGEVFGKPKNLAHAKAMLSRLSGCTHQVTTAVAVADAEGSCHVISQTSEVRFCLLSDRVIERYWETGEPQDKAGAYGIQGLGGSFVAELRGSYSSVMGLPVHETLLLLKSSGFAHHIAACQWLEGEQ